MVLVKIAKLGKPRRRDAIWCPRIRAAGVTVPSAMPWTIRMQNRFAGAGGSRSSDKFASSASPYPQARTNAAPMRAMIRPHSSPTRTTGTTDADSAAPVPLSGTPSIAMTMGRSAWLAVIEKAARLAQHRMAKASHRRGTAWPLGRSRVKLFPCGWVQRDRKDHQTPHNTPIAAALGETGGCGCEAIDATEKDLTLGETATVA